MTIECLLVCLALLPCLPQQDWYMRTACTILAAYGLWLLKTIETLQDEP